MLSLIMITCSQVGGGEVFFRGKEKGTLVVILVLHASWPLVERCTVCKQSRSPALVGLLGVIWVDRRAGGCLRPS